jgi:hypothetical protein
MYLINFIVCANDLKTISDTADADADFSDSEFNSLSGGYYSTKAALGSSTSGNSVSDNYEPAKKVYILMCVIPSLVLGLVFLPRALLFIYYRCRKHDLERRRMIYLIRMITCILMIIFLLGAVAALIAMLT